jgi:KaiC/GvpD/RAD55 family RecA-like ATPase
MTPGINPYYKGFILGPPGTGKSTATIAFASTITNEWNVTWIHLRREGDMDCIQFDGKQKKSVVLKSVSELEEILESAGTSKSIVFLDGFTYKYQIMEPFMLLAIFGLEIIMKSVDWL